MSQYLLEHLTGHGPLLPLSVLVSVGMLIFLLAARLAQWAEIIAEMTGLGGIWVGSLLLAGATSLPEIVTDVQAALLDVPDIGVGDLFGSTLANMLILAVLDLAYASRRILQQVAVEHALIGLLALLLTGMAGIAIASGGWGRIGHVGLETLAIMIVYVVAIRMIHRIRIQAPPAIPGTVHGAPPGRTGTWTAPAFFALAAGALALVTPLLVLSAKAAALETGTTATFVGTLLVGLTTSFPELAATVSAVRLGALDLAVGNIFGSNAFNMAVLLLVDVAYVHGPVLRAISDDHLLSALLAMTALTLGVMGVLSRWQRRVGSVMIESVLIIATYAAGAWLLAQGDRP